MEYFAPMATPITVMAIPILLMRFSPINFSRFDFVCGLFCMLAITMGKARAVGAAAYFFAHGFGHYSLANAEDMEERDINLQDTLVLAAILSIGPISITS